MGPYLTKLSSGLASSMVDPRQRIDITVNADPGALNADGALPSSHAVSIGLIVTELIINAVKYASPAPRSSARVRATFEMAKLCRPYPDLMVCDRTTDAWVRRSAA